MWFTRVSINQPVFAVMAMLAFVVLGLFSYNKLSVEQFPDISFPIVVISTEYPGASPEVIETDVTTLTENRKTNNYFPATLVTADGVVRKITRAS